jgi:hypothetical protein
VYLHCLGTGYSRRISPAHTPMTRIFGGKRHGLLKVLRKFITEASEVLLYTKHHYGTQ